MLGEMLGEQITLTKAVGFQEEKHIILKEMILTATMKVSIRDLVQEAEIILDFNLK